MSWPTRDRFCRIVGDGTEEDRQGNGGKRIGERVQAAPFFSWLTAAQNGPTGGLRGQFTQPWCEVRLVLPWFVGRGPVTAILLPSGVGGEFLGSTN